MQVSHIKPESFVDGPGRRTVLFMQGCPIHCAGCQNQQLWDAAAGHDVPADLLAANIMQHAGIGGSVTISGGEPFNQPLQLAILVRRLRELGAGHIIIYTGYKWDDITGGLPAWDAGQQFAALAAISRVDVVVDGPFVFQADDNQLIYRGSRNQRPIDVPATLANFRAGNDDLVLLAWDDPELVIKDDGTVLLPVGLADDFAELGDLYNTRRCGQTK